MNDVGCWLPIKYRDFYDVPRMFVVESQGKVFLFDCEFDDQLDDYPATYAVYRLQGDSIESIHLSDDWRALPGKGIRIATVGLDELKFDQTKRQFVDGKVLSRLKFE